MAPGICFCDLPKQIADPFDAKSGKFV